MVDRSVSKCNAFKFFCAKAPPHCLHLFSGCLPPPKKREQTTVMFCARLFSGSCELVDICSTVFGAIVLRSRSIFRA
jgi:hypothetical protein